MSVSVFFAENFRDGLPKDLDALLEGVSGSGERRGDLEALPADPDRSKHQKPFVEAAKMHVVSSLRIRLLRAGFDKLDACDKASAVDAAEMRWMVSLNRAQTVQKSRLFFTGLLYQTFI